MNKTKKFEEFIKNEKDKIIENKSIDSNKYLWFSSKEELKKALETVGLDLTKNQSKRIDLI